MPKLICASASTIIFEKKKTISSNRSLNQSWYYPIKIWPIKPLTEETEPARPTS